MTACPPTEVFLAFFSLLLLKPFPSRDLKKTTSSVERLEADIFDYC